MDGAWPGVTVSAAIGAAMAAAALLLLLWLVREAYRPPVRPRRAYRMLATAVAVGSLLAIGLRPQRSAIGPAGSAALLATPGATAERLGHLSDSLGPGLPVYTLGMPPEQAAAFMPAVPLPDAGSLSRRIPGLRTVYVAGHGLPGSAWEGLEQARLVPLLSPPDAGVRHVSWTRAPALGEELVVQGTVGGFEEPVRVVLQGPGPAADSAFFEAGGGTFDLRVRPRATGRLPYRLAVRTESGASTEEDTLGVRVVDPALPAVLVLEGAPGFEARFLKEWTGTRGGRIAIRSALGGDRFRADFLNLPELDLRVVTPGLLRRFDVLWIDAPSLRALSPRERAVLRTAVEWEGLGVLAGPEVLTGESPLPGEADARFYGVATLGARDDPAPRMVVPQWRRSPASLREPVPALPYGMELPDGMPPLLTDEAGQPLGALAVRGIGRVAVSVVTDTYRWVLAGEPEAHAAYWSHVLGSLTRPPEADRWIWPRDRLPRVDHPLNLTLVAAGALPEAFVDGPDGARVRLPLRQDVRDPVRWKAVFWPVRPGWHRVATSESEAWVYVHAGEAWRSAGQRVRSDDTRRRALETGGGGTEAEEAVRVPVPLWPFFASFVLACVYLWVEPRLPGAPRDERGSRPGLTARGVEEPRFGNRV